MTYRKLRIAWSAFWGLAAVLLIVLWVRDYRMPWPVTERFRAERRLLANQLFLIPHDSDSGESIIIRIDKYAFQSRLLVFRVGFSCLVSLRLVRLPGSAGAILTPHTTNRHDAGGRGAGVGGVVSR